MRDRVHAWAQERIAPRAAEFWERGEFQADRVLELGGLGVAGGLIGAYGCPSISAAAYGLASASLETEVGICSSGGGGGESGRTMPCIASQSSVGIISIASQGQPSRKAPSGPLLVHF